MKMCEIFGGVKVDVMADGNNLLRSHSRSARKWLETERMSVLGYFLGWASVTNFFGDSPMGLLSPSKKLQVRANALAQIAFLCHRSDLEYGFVDA